MGTYQAIVVTTLDVLRVSCGNCKAVIEIPVKRDLSLPEQCRCGTKWFTEMNNELTPQGQAIFTPH